MNAQQIACFSKLMEERDSHHLSISRDGLCERDAKIFIWQLGCLSDPLEMNSDSFEKAWRELFGASPVLPSRLNDSVEQASFHVDNWFALETGQFSLTYDVAQRGVAEAEAGAPHWEHVFRAQKYVELRRLQLAVAKGEGRYVHALSKIKFLGCVMDKVQRYLTTVCTTKRINFNDWSPSIVPETFPVFCSHQLSDALQEAAAEANGEALSGTEATSETEKIQQTSLQMRVLWEIHTALTPKSFPGDPTSSSLMMYCMLGYPSLRMSQVDSCLCLRIIANEQENSGRNFIVPVGTDDESDSTRRVHTEEDDSIASTRKCLAGKHLCLRIDIVEAPQPLHIMFQWNSEKKQATVQIGCNAGPAAPRFCWKSWIAGFMGRMCAQSEWRSTRLHHTNEMLEVAEIESSLPTENEGIAEVSEFDKSPFPCWGWFPFLVTSRMPRDERSITSTTSTTSEVKCECGCKANKTFLEAKKLLDGGEVKDAVQRFRACVVDHKHSLALEDYVCFVIRKLPENEKLLPDLLLAMEQAITLTGRGKSKNLCQSFEHYDLEKLIGLLGKVYDKSQNERALHYQRQALVLRSLEKDAVDERCVEAFESLLMSRQCHPMYWGDEDVFLALCYYRKYCSGGRQFDKEIGFQHLKRVCVPSHTHMATLDFAFLTEKGTLSAREFETVDSLSVYFPDASGFWVSRYMVEFVHGSFLWSHAVKYRLPANAKAAARIYQQVISGIPDDNWEMFRKARALNRLGSDDIPKNREEAEKLYIKAKLSSERVGCIEHSINAMCNLAVLYGQQDDDGESAEKSVQLFQDAIETYENWTDREWDDRHSSSMNNLAVIMELGKIIRRDVDNAKKLYLRSIEIDENPIAMYNLAVLLKFEDPRPQNLEEANRLFSAVADLGADLQSMPVLNAQLPKAREAAVTEISGAFAVDVDEIDDCLAYVKMVDSTL